MPSSFAISWTRILAMDGSVGLSRNHNGTNILLRQRRALSPFCAGGDENRRARLRAGMNIGVFAYGYQEHILARSLLYYKMEPATRRQYQ
jgi:hypothetical protein